MSSSILEVDLVLARKQQREAITSHEVEAAAHSLGLLLEYLQTLEDCWTGVRWIRNVLSGNNHLDRVRSFNVLKPLVISFAFLCLFSANVSDLCWTDSEYEG